MLSGLLFQFHKGTIRTLWLIVQTLWVCNFNSIKVQLELNNASARNMVANFNSIKVQLERMANRSNIMGLQFQFHKGTIRTCMFNFCTSLNSYFNSIKVQLEHLVPSRTGTLNLFQFHKGTIRTSLPFYRHSRIFRYFNSIKVQLERISFAENITNI